MQAEKKYKIKKIEKNVYQIDKEGPMKVPLRIFASEKLLKKIEEDDCIQQGINAATMPGIQKYSIMMPDAHLGYGVSVGAVIAFDSETGVISPGATGFDINCGVRLLSTNLSTKEVEPKIKQLLDLIFQAVPSGVGRHSEIRLTNNELDNVLKEGANWAVKKGYGNEDDIKHCEEYGNLKNADPSKVSNKAKERGKNQLGTLGAGNHFVEIQIVDKIYNKETAKSFGIDNEGQICVMIHCGSRGLGHQVCSDYLRLIEDKYPDIMKSLPDKDLAYAPVNSKVATDYFKAMNAAANFAWCNRHIIADNVRRIFKKVLKNVELNTVYDVAHNIIKLEEYKIDGKLKKVYVHRKGATRAFGPAKEEIPENYKKTGQPVLIPGSMGTASYVLVGTNKAIENTFGSTAHGAGRMMSRHAAIRNYRGEEIKNELEKRHIYIKGASWKGIAEEAPLAYKDVDEVVKVSHEVGIGNLVVRLIPLGVVKG
ncbi:RtcB family protein [Candidatus Woesearchaeota archaeon]|nr:RtcB family protein [Candidatus Woesearchaeota archaeon]